MIAAQRRGVERSVSAVGSLICTTPVRKDARAASGATQAADAACARWLEPRGGFGFCADDIAAGGGFQSLLKYCRAGDCSMRDTLPFFDWIYD